MNKEIISNYAHDFRDMEISELELENILTKFSEEVENEKLLDLKKWVEEADIREWKILNPKTGETAVDYDQLLNKINELLKDNKE